MHGAIKIWFEEGSFTTDAAFGFLKEVNYSRVDFSISDACVCIANCYCGVFNQFLQQNGRIITWDLAERERARGEKEPECRKGGGISVSSIHVESTG